jgi:cellulose synthase/poly-beta-1,6-N-acetylglucosamine synthase-like glycosyltransferase
LEIIQVLQYLVISCFVIPIFVFGIYGLILVYYRRSKTRNTKIITANISGFEPHVSIVTPTHNEETIISKKIENLLISNYPKEKLEIIFIDDSTDSTAKIIQAYAEKYPFIHLIKFAKRMGYSPCMFAGVKVSTGEIIVLSDAGSFHDEDTIENLVRHFRDPAIGAVTGKDVILNSDEAIGSSETLYLRIYNFVRTAETNMDSTFYFKGEASAVRKSLIADFEGCGATFDTATALFIRQKGYKTIFDSAAKFYEYAPRTREERIKQKTIRAANWIKILMKFKGMTFRYKYGKFGLLTLPANFGMLILTPIAILAGLISLIALSFFNPIPSLFIWVFLGSAVLLSYAISRSLPSTFVDLEISLLKALFEITFTKTKHDQIDTVKSTRR